MLLLSLVFCFILTAQSASASEIDIQKIQQAIDDQHARWSAGETARTQLSSNERRLSLGLLRDPNPSKKLFKLPPYRDLPSSFSWRDNNGNYITPVKDQGMCGACSYFSSCAAVESWLKIKERNPRLNIDLSEQFVLSCGNVGSCENGAFIEHVHQFLASTGTPGEECFPYRQNDDVSCSEACPDWVNQMVRIGDFVVITYDPTNINEIKNAVFHHPVVAGLDIYSDFNAYTGGVFQHVTGDMEGQHAVLIYGWEDSTQSWLCKNSWGTSWGESGHFRIKWGDSRIGSPVVMIWDERTATAELNVQPSRLHPVMSPGESTRQYLELENTGTGPLEYVIRVETSTVDGIKPADMSTDYLSIPFGTGTLAAGRWIQLPVDIAMDEYTLGTVRGEIEISTNDGKVLYIPYTIEVKFSEYDIGISEMSLPSFNWSVLFRFAPSMRLKNWGRGVLEGIPSQCTILDSSGTEIYVQKVELDSVPAVDSKKFEFPEFSFKEPGAYKLMFKITPTLDENNYNNSYETWINVKSFVDDFEQENILWNCTDGWGRTDLLSGGHNSKFHMHVNQGHIYENNVQADLAFSFPVDLSSYNSAVLKFWTRYIMEKGRDRLLIQACADTQTWITVDSLSGNNPKWHEHQTDISRFTGLNFEKVFIRFRFISNERQTGLGPMIDDVRLMADYNSEMNHVKTPNFPGYFDLLPNFPNPFNPVTMIRYDVAEPSWIRMNIYNIKGQWLEELFYKYHDPGHYQLKWDGTLHPSGMYIYKMEITTLKGKRYVLSNKMLLIQ